MGKYSGDPRDEYGRQMGVVNDVSVQPNLYRSFLVMLIEDVLERDGAKKPKRRAEAVVCELTAGHNTLAVQMALRELEKARHA